MSVHTLVFSGMMAGLAAILQTGPVWLGQPAGFVPALLAFLPAAMAAAAGGFRAGALTVIVASLLCGLIHPEEGWVFLFTNGPFGVAQGLVAHLRHPRRALLPAGVLLAGMSALTWGVGVAALGPELLGYGISAATGIYALFALFWSEMAGWLVADVDRRVRPGLHARAPRSSAGGSDPGPPAPTVQSPPPRGPTRPG